MVSAREPSFYDLDKGNNNTKIEGTKGSLLTLPVATNSEIEYQLIACNGPKPNTQLSFWRDLVLEYEVPLIVNLCEIVDNSENSYNGCCWYWPTTEEPLKIDGDRLVVTMENAVPACSTLMQYSLNVKQVLDDGSERTASVTLLYFKGWPELTVPGADNDIDIKTGQVITKAE